MQTILSDPTRNVHPADPSRRPDPHPARHAAARRSFPHTPTPCPTCPGCSGLLEPVRQSDTSPLNRHQFDAVKAGDWFCRNCKGDRSATGFRYYWNHELPAVVVIDETRGQTLDPADASEAPASCPVCNGSGSIPGTTEDVEPPECPRCFGTGAASGDVLDNCGPACPACEGRGEIRAVPTVADPAHSGGLLGRYADALDCGLAAAEADFSDLLADDARNELAALDELARMSVRECPGLLIHCSIVLRRGYLADGSPVRGRKARRPMVSLMGTDGQGWCDVASDEDAEKAFAVLAGKFKAAHQA
jgi:hypothetical protein